MPTLHIGPAVSEKNGTEFKGFSFIVMGHVLSISSAPFSKGLLVSRDDQLLYFGDIPEG